MTTGYINTDRTVPVTNGRRGLSYFRSWTGGDRSNTGRPVKPVPVPSFRDYANHLNLNQFRKSVRFSILEDTYARWRTAREAYLEQLKAYHIAKAAWIKAHRAEVHPYDFTLQSIAHSFGDYWNNPGGWGGTNVSLDGTFSFSTPVPAWSNNDEIALISSIQSKLDGGIGFHAGVAVAEIDQALRMIRDGAKRFRRISESLSSGDLNKAMRVAFNGSAANHVKGIHGLMGIADNYLLYQFGVKPLIQDVLDGARSYGYKAGRPKSIRVSVSRKNTSRTPGPSHGFWSCPCDSSYGKSIVCYLETDNIVDESGLLDLPSIAWERIPYSFVVDWWVPVGTYLSALHTARLVSNSSAIFCRTETTKIFSGPIKSGSLYSVTEHDRGSYTSIRQIRTLVNDLAVPPPSVKPLLHQSTEVSLRHTLEAISLIIQKAPLLKKVWDAHQRASELAKAGVYTE